MKNKREFYVETPLGFLRVSAKDPDDTDKFADYPGVYVEFVKDKDDRWGELLATIEYDSEFERILTAVYDKDADAPVTIVDHTNKEFLV